MSPHRITGGRPWFLVEYVNKGFNLCSTVKGCGNNNKPYPHVPRMAFFKKLIKGNNRGQTTNIWGQSKNLKKGVRLDCKQKILCDS